MLTLRNERYSGAQVVVELYDGDRYVATMNKEDAANDYRIHNRR